MGNILISPVNNTFASQSATQGMGFVVSSGTAFYYTIAGTNIVQIRSTGIVWGSSNTFNIGSSGTYAASIFATAFTVESSSDIKKNIEPLSNIVGGSCLNFLNTLEPVSYALINPTETNNHTYFGFIAESGIQSLFPYTSILDTDGFALARTDIEIDNDGNTISNNVIDPLSYTAIIAGSVQELNTIVNSLKNTINKMQIEIDDLKLKIK